MPMIELTAPAGALTEAMADDLAERLTGALIRWRGVPDSPRSRANAWFNLLAARQWIGGQRTCMPHYVVRASIVDGGMDVAAKAGFVEEVTRHVREVDLLAEEVWVLIDEVRDGNWGAGGEITRLAASQAILGGS
jgi:phenylpyruvate tautomerase PptA (4-oxalocrotonate tautomerase family)